MIVDDHPIMRLGLGAIIRNSHDMLLAGAAENGETAIELFAKLQPDITIMDLRLPGITGIETICALRSRYPAARFLAITAHDGDESLHLALKAGASSYLMKGMDHKVLLDAIRRVHCGEHFIPLPVALHRNCS